MRLIALIFLFCATHLFSAESKTFLVFGGHSGWIGKQIMQLVKESGHYAIAASSRLENREEIIHEISQICPDYIFNCAGVTGNPNVDWCEDHKIETIRTNIIGTLNLLDVAYIKGVHVTNFSSGCIYEYDQAHPLGSGIGFKEEEIPNFQGSHYSTIKGLFEQIVKFYPNVLDLRLRMPITSTVHKKNFITKITKYKKVVNIPNSMTILDDMLPVALDMALHNYTGIFNFVNPGVISHNEILDLYREYVDPMFVYTNFTVEEQDKILKSRRSNNELNVDKLLSIYPELPHIKDSIQRVLKKMK